MFYIIYKQYRYTINSYKSLNNFIYRPNITVNFKIGSKKINIVIYQNPIICSNKFLINLINVQTLLNHIPFHI